MTASEGKTRAFVKGGDFVCQRRRALTTGEDDVIFQHFLDVGDSVRSMVHVDFDSLGEFGDLVPPFCQTSRSQDTL